MVPTSYSLCKKSREETSRSEGKRKSEKCRSNITVLANPFTITKGNREGTQQGVGSVGEGISRGIFGLG